MAAILGGLRQRLGRRWDLIPDGRERAQLDRRLAAVRARSETRTAGRRSTTRSPPRRARSTRQTPALPGRSPTTSSGTGSSWAAARSGSTTPRCSGRRSRCSGSAARRPSSASASCSRRSATAPRRTAASPTGSTAWVALLHGDRLDPRRDRLPEDGLGRRPAHRRPGPGGRAPAARPRPAGAVEAPRLSRGGAREPRSPFEWMRERFRNRAPGPGQTPGPRRRPPLRRVGGGARLRRRRHRAGLAPGVERGGDRRGADRRLGARPLRARRYRPQGALRRAGARPRCCSPTSSDRGAPLLPFAVARARAPAIPPFDPTQTAWEPLSPGPVGSGVGTHLLRRDQSQGW